MSGTPPSASLCSVTFSPEEGEEVGRGSLSSPSSEGEVGERSEPGGGVVRKTKRTDHAKSLARNLRSEPTDAERVLWSRLKGRQLNGLRFRRQSPIGPYVADFLCAEARLVVEVDGSQHAQQQLDHDTERTAWLEREGYRVVRFWNSDVRRHIDQVLETILVEAEASMLARAHSSPSSEGEVTGETSRRG